MTSSEQPQDISTRINNIDTRLEELRDELDLVRTMQNGMRREVNSNSQRLSSVAALERTVTQLADVARFYSLLASATLLYVKVYQIIKNANVNVVTGVPNFLINPLHKLNKK